MFDLTGKTIGKYRLVEKRGQGGMAQVYKAYQAELDRYVAVKVIHPNLTGDEAFAARFRREARAVAALDHPNIVRVYDFDTDNGLAFLVMEYLEGISLREKLRELSCRDERMELEEVEHIVCALCDALDHAHRQGMVHRDIKPSNVMITDEGRPVLCDFGIARMVDTTAITGSGGTLGTPAYMSPEQGRGEPGDARSDIYALGVLLYQLCTGRVPFDADTPYAVILKHITAPLPSPRLLRPDLPEAVERVILKALAKDPDHRYQTAGEMGRALKEALRSRKMAPLRPRRPIRRGVLWAMGGLAALVVLAGLLFAVRPWRLFPTPAPTPLPGSTVTLVLEGPEVTADTWLDPDTPDTSWHEADLIHLQGPLTPDRFLVRFDLSGLPADARVLSATLTLRVELWHDESFPGAAVIYRVLTAWDPTAATYNSPWSGPGLVAGWDYDPTPLDIVPLPDTGVVAFDVRQALAAWRERGEPNNGLVVMMSEDSDNRAHHWLYTSEQPSPADRPTLTVVYEAGP